MDADDSGAVVVDKVTVIGGVAEAANDDVPTLDQQGVIVYSVQHEHETNSSRSRTLRCGVSFGCGSGG